MLQISFFVERSFGHFYSLKDDKYGVSLLRNLCRRKPVAGIYLVLGCGGAIGYSLWLLEIALLFSLENDDGYIVHPTVFVSLFHQQVTGILRACRTEQNVSYLVVSNHFPEAIGA